MSSNSPNLIVLYQWEVGDTDLPAFRACWANATEQLKRHGAMGSLLAVAADGTCWAIALWPDRTTREQAELDYIDTDAWPPVKRLQTVMLDSIENRWNFA